VTTPTHPRPHPHPGPTGWLPASPCGPACMTGAPGAAVPGVVVAARMVALAAVLLTTFAVAPLVPPAARLRWLSSCYRATLRAVGVRLRVTGSVPPGGVLLVSNHLSWIEILAVGALAPVRMLAKQEVRDWPLVGGLAARSGALFVDRAGLRALPATVAAMAEALRAGAVVGVFPEGTTWCGAAAGPFRRAAFQAAIDAGVPVVPVAVVLHPPADGPQAAAAFIGEETLWEALQRVLRMRGLECSLTVLPALAPVPDRRELARRAGAAVATVTGVPHPAGRSRAPLPAVAA
jgi:1-acyl-sn-glycerol-3-phosphate acyltransferase